MKVELKFLQRLLFSQTLYDRCRGFAIFILGLITFQSDMNWVDCELIWYCFCPVKFWTLKLARPKVLSCRSRTLQVFFCLGHILKNCSNTNHTARNLLNKSVKLKPSFRPRVPACTKRRTKDSQLLG